VTGHQRLAESAQGPQAAYERWTSGCAAAGLLAATESEQVPVSDGLGRATSAEVLARWDCPLTDCAAMDGIAFKAASVGQQAEGWLTASSFRLVDTGDPLPAGLDTVVQRERVEFGPGGSARITGRAEPGLNVRAAGEDFLAGERLIPAGHWLRPADLAVAAAAGHGTLTVARRPVVAIVPTGNEIRPAGSALRPGEVSDSNSILLAARACEAGAQPAVSAIQPDDRAAIAAEVRTRAGLADLVLVIAGSSAGRGDHTPAVLAEVGGMSVRGVAIRPGHPVLLGHVSLVSAAVPVIGVPGYPLAAAVIFEVFAVPLLAALLGARPASRIRQRAELASDWTSPAALEDWVPVSLSASRAGLLATPGRRGAGSTARLMRAGAWWQIPIGQGHFARGDQIEVQLLPGAPA